MDKKYTHQDSLIRLLAPVEEIVKYGYALKAALDAGEVGDSEVRVWYIKALSEFGRAAGFAQGVLEFEKFE